MKKCRESAEKMRKKAPENKKRAGEPALSFQATNNYLDAAGAAAAADAEAEASAALAFLAFLTFFAFGADAEASAEAAAGAEAAGASAAKAETANMPAIKAAIRFFIFVVSQKDFDEIVIQLNQTN
jgi:hypothetical protein